MKRVNKTRFAILGCLSVKPMSAYDIKAFMARSTSYFWMEYEAQLYPMLKKLDETGEVSCVEEKAQKVSTRKIYHITDKGMEVLKEWLSSKTEQANYRNEFLLKIFFSNQIEKPVVIKQLELYRHDVLNDLETFDHIQKNVLPEKAHDKRHVFRQATLNYGLHILQAELAWCDESLNLITHTE